MLQTLLLKNNCKQTVCILFGLIKSFLLHLFVFNYFCSLPLTETELYKSLLLLIVNAYKYEYLLLTNPNKFLVFALYYKIN